MQRERRSNRDRTEQTRSALLRAARSFFIAKGYSETSTPEIVGAAGATRGALYHHFEDKRALFRAVVQDEARAVAQAIEVQASPPQASALDALLAGSEAYLDAMSEPGRTRLLLVEGPSVLGPAEMTGLDEAHAMRTLRVGLEAAMNGSEESGTLSLSALTDLLSAAFDRAALAIDGGADRNEYSATIAEMIRRLLRNPGC